MFPSRLIRRFLRLSVGLGWRAKSGHVPLKQWESESSRIHGATTENADETTFQRGVQRTDMLCMPRPLNEMLTTCCSHGKNVQRGETYRAFPYISPALKGTTPRLSGDSKAKISCCADQSYSRYIQNPFKWNSVGLAPLLRAQLSTVTLISDRHTNTLPRHCCNFLMSPRSSAPRAGSVASRREFTTCDKCRAL